MELPDPDNSSSEQETGGKVIIQLGDMDLPSWEHDLKVDLDVIEALLAEMGKVSPTDDAKLQASTLPALWVPTGPSPHLRERLTSKNC